MGIHWNHLRRPFFLCLGSSMAEHWFVEPVTEGSIPPLSTIFTHRKRLKSINTYDTINDGGVI